LIVSSRGSLGKEKKAMRDVFIERIYERMLTDKNVFFLTADFGSPVLDKLRDDFKDRFINVGIAEQNLVNIAAGLATEGFCVYAYAIAPFLTMRAFEQIRNNLSLLSRAHKLNVNLIGVGAGLSYDLSGPSHHSVEDICIMRALPYIDVISPSDWVLAEKIFDYTAENKRPKYLRFDGKPLPAIYDCNSLIDFRKGFVELAEGDSVCLVSTGYMTHTALKVIEELKKEGLKAGLIDLYFLKPFSKLSLSQKLSKYKYLITIEEGFINKGGLDSLISTLIESEELDIKLKRIGFDDMYVFDVGSREYLHGKYGLDYGHIVNLVKDIKII